LINELKRIYGLTKVRVTNLKKTLSITAALLVLFIAIHMIPPVQVKADQTLLCPTLENPVTMDGKWTSSQEWSDAYEGKLVFLWGSGEAYFRIKHDDDFLYLFVDYVSLTTPQERDAAGILVDTNNDGGEIMQNDDYYLTYLYISESTAFLVRGWGTGSKIINDFSDFNWQYVMTVDWELNPKNFSADSTVDTQNNPYSTQNHVQWEFKIPKSEFKHNTIRFLAYAINAKNENGASYPVTDLDKLDHPNLWVQLEFSNKTLRDLATQTTAATSITPSTITTSSAITTTSTATTTSLFAPTSTAPPIITQTENQFTPTTTTDSITETSSPLGVPGVAFLLVLAVIIIIVVTLYLLWRRPSQHNQGNASYRYCINCGKKISAESLTCNKCTAK
jgi:hypothetical protein